jgi:hypothetical protein
LNIVTKEPDTAVREHFALSASKQYWLTISECDYPDITSFDAARWVAQVDRAVRRAL